MILSDPKAFFPDMDRQKLNDETMQISNSFSLWTMSYVKKRFLRRDHSVSILFVNNSIQVVNVELPLQQTVCPENIIS